MSKKSTTLFGIPLYNGTYREFFQKIEHPEKKTLVFTPNPEIFVRASRESEFMEILSGATYNVPDANGLYVGYMMLEGRSFFASALRTFFCKKSVRDEYGELIKWSDLTRDILEWWKTTPRKILIIDRKNAVPKNDLERKKAEIQKDLKNILEEKYPWIEIFIVFDGEVSTVDMAKIIEDQGIDFVFSCIGMKNQEKRLLEVFAHLGENQKVVWLWVGASIDFLLGLQKRAPIIFQRLGLEWLYRFITQPRIRARRIWDAVYHFQKLIKNSSD
jgi:N-acetylglucosaminyldiphosphoundecaprenol N-acetyl-beta-D-mannosaminyltransferase